MTDEIWMELFRLMDVWLKDCSWEDVLELFDYVVVEGDV